MSKSFVRFGISSFVLFTFSALYTVNTRAQSNEFIYTKEGKPILRRSAVIHDCIRSLNANDYDNTAETICECQADALNRKFTNRQIREHTSGRMIDIAGLLADDSIVKKSLDNCYLNSGKTALLQARGFESEFIDSCIAGLRKNADHHLDDDILRNFCSCQLDLIKEKQLSDADLKQLENPNSLLFYEVMYKCGDPFSTKEKTNINWTKNTKDDVSGPESDTIHILTMNGLTYVQAKTGSLVQFWLFDTGASDLLINADMEKTLQQQNLLTQQNYLGTGEYELANGTVDTCRRYLLNEIGIGKYVVNNVVIAVTDKGKRIVVGRSLLNKFANWKLDNEKDVLILNK